MTSGQYPHELVVLVADKNMELAIRGILGRAQAMGIQELMPVVHVHPERDPGCLLRGHDFLSIFRNQFAHALILLDREGCGQEKSDRVTLEEMIEKRLSESGWGERAAAVVIDPELEMWVWSDSPQVDAVLGWQGKNPDLRSWLKAKNFLQEGQAKPERPKEAMELALRTARKSRSSSLYDQLARQVSLGRCVDPAFNKLKTTLQTWFPRAGRD
jgi:hypothetical protein